MSLSNRNNYFPFLRKLLSSFRETRPDEAVPPGKKFIRMELPEKTNFGGRKSPSTDHVMEKKADKPELKPLDIKIDAEDSVPAGWKMTKFEDDLDVLLTSPQVRNL